MSAGTIDSLVSEMEQILVRNGQEFHAEYLATMRRAESHQFEEMARSLDLWGGTGSVIDSPVSDLEDSRRFLELVIDLNEALEHIGLDTPRSRQVALLTEDWLIQNPSR